jgi:hypothetical protein
MLNAPNARGKPNSDVLRLFRNGSDLVQTDSRRWVIDYGVDTPLEAAFAYEAPFAFIEKHVRPFRETNNRPLYRERWWIHAEPRPGFRRATSDLPRYLGTARVAKHRLFVWQDSSVLPDSKVIAIAIADDCRFGVLQSRIHEVWTKATQALHGGERPTYNPTECFETFPFPFALKEPLPQGESTPQSEAEAAHHFFAKEPPAPYGEAAHRAAIAAAAKELNDLRERWLNPPEWTRTVTLEFPGSVGGPWSRFLDPATVNAQTGVGTVRYPRLEPRDATCAAELKKRTLTALYNERPAWLDHAHRKLDAAVAAAYGWPADLSDEQVLERLLALNLARAAAESAATAKPKHRKPQREKSADELL